MEVKDDNWCFLSRQEIDWPSSGVLSPSFQRWQGVRRGWGHWTSPSCRETCTASTKEIQNIDSVTVKTESRLIHTTTPSSSGVFFSILLICSFPAVPQVIGCRINRNGEERRQQLLQSAVNHAVVASVKVA